MNKISTYVLCLLLSCFAAYASAQSYDVVERRNFWNSGNNITGLRMDSLTVSFAELSGRNMHGGFRDTYEAKTARSAQIEAKSITHKEKYSMAGSFTFSHTRGNSMSGSMFIDPGYYPIDVLEFTPGRKDRQSYGFTGGIAGDITSQWRLGGKIDFLASNYTKRKDLRYTNYALDLTIAPGVMYHSDDFAVGLAYVFGKKSERIKAEQVGTGTFDAFLDKGLMYGAYEDWEGSGTLLAESGLDGLPVNEISHGVSIQGEWKKLFAEVTYTHSEGEIGEKRIIWFKFPTDRLTSQLGYRFGNAANIHFARINVEWSQQKNNENVMDKETSNGITLNRIYARNCIFERDFLSLNPEYEWQNSRGEFRFGSEISYMKRRSTQTYPYVFSQKMTRYRIYASGVVHAGRFDIKLGGAFSSGSKTERFRTVDGDIDAGDPPYHLKEYYDINNEYLTASRITIDAGVRYRFFQALYTEIGVRYTRGFDLKHIAKSDRWCETIKIGYTF